MLKVKSINHLGINSNSINSNSNSSINGIKEINKDFNIKNYDFALFKHKPNNSTILKSNLNFLNKSYNEEVFDNAQWAFFARLALSTNNKLEHPVIIQERDNKLHYIVKTSKDSKFCYWNEEKAALQIGNVLPYEKGGFLSNVNFCVSLDSIKSESLINNSLFVSIKGNDNLMEYYNFKNENSLRRQLEIFDCIVEKNELISVNYLKKNNFHLLDHMYDVAKLSYVSGKITQKVWDNFLNLYNEELERLSLNNNNNDE